MEYRDIQLEGSRYLQLKEEHTVRNVQRFAKQRGTRGKGRKINYKSEPRNLGKLLEEIIKHLSTAHDCKDCEQIIVAIKTNLLSPFGIRCYTCEELISDSMLNISNEGRTYCQKCATTPALNATQI